MNRWRSRLAELQNNIEEALPVQNVQNVQKSVLAVGFEQFEQFEQRGGSVPDTAKPWSDAEEERAAIAEYDGGAPRAWAEALARLDPNKPPSDVPPWRWQRFVDDCGRVLDGGWAVRAAAFGWGPLDRILPWAIELCEVFENACWDRRNGRRGRQPRCAYQ